VDLFVSAPLDSRVVGMGEVQSNRGNRRFVFQLDNGFRWA